MTPKTFTRISKEVLEKLKLWADINASKSETFPKVYVGENIVIYLPLKGNRSLQVLVKANKAILGIETVYRFIEAEGKDTIRIEGNVHEIPIVTGDTENDALAAFRVIRNEIIVVHNTANAIIGKTKESTS